jgi:hypothetical protein
MTGQFDKLFDYSFSVFSLRDVSQLSSSPLPDQIKSPSQIQDQRPAARYVSFSIGIDPGPVVFSFIEGGRSSITGQMSAKLATDSIVERILDGAAGHVRTLQSAQIIQGAFREANRQLYSYGAKMLGSGKLSASGITACFDGERFSVGRTGGYECYLFRGGRLVRFYESDSDDRNKFNPNAMDRLLGQNKQVLVDIASVKVEEGDVMVVTSFPYFPDLQTFIAEAIVRERRVPALARQIASEGVRYLLSQRAPGQWTLERNVVCAIFQLLEVPITLEEVVVE